MSSFKSQINACVSMHKDIKLLDVVNSTLHDVSNICGKGPMANSTAVSLQRKLNLTEKVLSIHKENGINAVPGLTWN